MRTGAHVTSATFFKMNSTEALGLVATLNTVQLFEYMMKKQPKADTIADKFLGKNSLI